MNLRQAALTSIGFLPTMTLFGKRLSFQVRVVISEGIFGPVPCVTDLKQQVGTVAECIHGNEVAIITSSLW